MSMSDALGTVRANAAAANAARVNGTPPGPLSGFEALDRELNGCFAPGVHILHGQPGAGKTAFALQIAAQCQCPAMFVTCEMSPAELLRRHTARATTTFLGRLKSGEYTADHVERLALEACETAPDLRFVDATRDPAIPTFLMRAAEATKGDADHLLIVVDSLHSWVEGIADEAQEYESLNTGIAALRRLAHLMDCPVLAVAERNRGAMADGGLSAGAGTRKIEYGAETVIDLQRDPKQVENGAGEVEINLCLHKNRHGAAGKSVQLIFNGALQSFSEL